MLLRAGAEAGLAEAQALYGQILLDGRGVAADPVAALGWFRRAAGAGHVMAINMIGRWLTKRAGAKADRVAAAHWYKVAAEAGLDWGMHNYGGALGPQRGRSAGRRRRSAGSAGRRRWAMPSRSTSSAALRGWEDRAPRHLGQAAQCYRQAAEGDRDFRGQFNHARLLAEAGRPEEALPWPERAGEGASSGLFAGDHARYRTASPVEALRRAAATL